MKINKYIDFETRKILTFFSGKENVSVSFNLRREWKAEHWKVLAFQTVDKKMYGRCLSPSPQKTKLWIRYKVLCQYIFTDTLEEINNYDSTKLICWPQPPSYALNLLIKAKLKGYKKHMNTLNFQEKMKKDINYLNDKRVKMSNLRKNNCKNKKNKPTFIKRTRWKLWTFRKIKPIQQQICSPLFILAK